MTAVIRVAQPSDIDQILDLIRGLASYEREPDAVETTAEDLHRALFGPEPRVWAHVAVAPDGGPGLAGMALWFLAFSTWTGQPTLYLEDLFVRPEVRSSGLGRQLVAALAARAVELGCARMDWSVLDWNESAQGFYRSIGAAPMEEWTTWRVSGPALLDLARSAQ